MDIPIESVLSVLTYECSEYDDGHLEWWIQLPSQPVFVTDTEEELRQMVRTYLETLADAIVSPATPQPDVSLEPQADDGWEIYEPVVGERYSPGTQARHKNDDWDPDAWAEYSPGKDRWHGQEKYDGNWSYRRPIPKPVEKTSAEDTAQLKAAGLYRECRAVDRQPLDVHLPEIERKVLLASKDNPALLDWWRRAKEALAIEAGKRIGGGK